MMEIKDALVFLRDDFRNIAQLEQQRQEILNSTMPAAMKDDREKMLKEEIERRGSLLAKLLRELVDFPPHHVRHGPLLEQFYQAAAYEKSVFIMTKFPKTEQPGPEDLKLAEVIETVRTAVKNRGYVPRLASDRQYHPILWDNVELYLLGSQRAIAIMEDKCQPELNPNVAMEWGWMRGMGRNVLYLVEKDFHRNRADWDGLIKAQFDWAAPQASIAAATDGWFN
jgi:hypothetical protein